MQVTESWRADLREYLFIHCLGYPTEFDLIVPLTELTDHQFQKSSEVSILFSKAESVN
jgi:hypothetical protein